MAKIWLQWSKLDQNVLDLQKLVKFVQNRPKKISNPKWCILREVKSFLVALDVHFSEFFTYFRGKMY